MEMKERVREGKTTTLKKIKKTVITSILSIDTLRSCLLDKCCELYPSIYATDTRHSLLALKLPHLVAHIDFQSSCQNPDLSRPWDDYLPIKQVRYQDNLAACSR